ncbi:MAG: nucleoside triphosphate pyrophosphohydrolase [Patescibacteria group bacterium]|nr:nucleoside triphosphate pyrophosphohydrolase [Patescibacteria group bacterium]
MKKITYHKLIRDKIPEVIAAHGSQAKTKKLNAKDFEIALLNKLSEEAREVVAAKSKIELTFEVGDVLDVLDEIIKLKKLKPADIKKARQINLARKGGFKKRLFLLWSSDDGYKTRKKNLT